MINAATSERIEPTSPTPASVEEMGVNPSGVEMTPILARLSEQDCEALVTDTSVLRAALLFDEDHQAAFTGNGFAAIYIDAEAGGVLPVTMSMPSGASLGERESAVGRVLELQKVAAEVTRKSQVLKGQISIAEMRARTCSREERSQARADLRNSQVQLERLDNKLSTAIDGVQEELVTEVPPLVFESVLAVVNRVVGSGKAASTPELDKDRGDVDSPDDGSDDNRGGKNRGGKGRKRVLPVVLVLSLITPILAGCAPTETVESPATEEPTDVPAAKPADVSVVDPTSVPVVIPTETPMPVPTEAPEVEASGGDYPLEIQKRIESEEFLKQREELTKWAEIWGWNSEDIHFKYMPDLNRVDGEGNPDIIVGLELADGRIAFPRLDRKVSIGAVRQVFHSADSADSIPEDERGPWVLTLAGPVDETGLLSDTRLAVLDGQLVRVDEENNIVGEIEFRTEKWVQTAHTYTGEVLGVEVSFTVRVDRTLLLAAKYPVREVVINDDVEFTHYITGEPISSLEMLLEFAMYEHWEGWLEDDPSRVGTSFEDYMALVKQGGGKYWVKAALDDPSLSIADRNKTHRVEVDPLLPRTVVITDKANPGVAFISHSGFGITKKKNGEIEIEITFNEGSRELWYDDDANMEFKVTGCFSRALATLAFPEGLQEATHQIGADSYFDSPRNDGITRYLWLKPAQVLERGPLRAVLN